MTVTRYENRPASIEAVQWTGDNLAEVQELVPAASAEGDTLTVASGMTAQPTEWIAKDAIGNVNVWSDTDFQASYREVPA